MCVCLIVFAFSESRLLFRMFSEPVKGSLSGSGSTSQDWAKELVCEHSSWHLRNFCTTTWVSALRKDSMLSASLVCSQYLHRLHYFFTFPYIVAGFPSFDCKYLHDNQKKAVSSMLDEHSIAPSHPNLSHLQIDGATSNSEVV